MPQLREVFAQEMNNKNMTFKDVGMCCDISTQMVIDVLAGRFPTEATIQKICNGLSIDRNAIDIDPLNMSIEDASVMTGKTKDFIRIAIEQGRMPGACIVSDTGYRNYHIPRKAFENYMGLIGSFSLDVLTDMLAHELAKKECL